MVIELSCKNFRSFKDETSLSLVAEGRIKDLDGYTRVLKSGDSPGLLSSTGLFGLNAGGKTNLFKALQVAVYVASNRDYDRRLASWHSLIAPFKLDKKSEEKPTEIEIILWDKDNNTEYKYGFHIDKEIILREYLYTRHKERTRLTRRKIFERNQAKFSFGAGVSGSVKRFCDSVRPDASAVSVFSQANHSESMRLIDLIKPPNLIILNVESSRESLNYAIKKQANMDLGKIADIVQKADLGIADIDFNTEVIPLKKLEPNLRQAIAPIISMMPSVSGSRDRETFTIKKATTVHHQYDDNHKRSGEAKFNLAHDESSGTGMFIGLITAAAAVLSSGGVLVIDELGASMHPFLTKMVVDQFDSPGSNPKLAQLIYNSHETYLLGQEAGLRRDQIWLTDKNKFGESELKRLSEYRTRKDFDIGRNYLAGRFGAIPFIGHQHTD